MPTISGLSKNLIYNSMPIIETALFEEYENN